MNNHIVIINSPKNNRDIYFERFVKQVRENAAHKKTPVVLINTDYPNGLPQVLVNLGVHYVHGHGNHDQDFIKSNMENAQHILILANDEYLMDSDSFCFDLCHRMHERGLAYRVIVECVEDENRRRLKKLGVKTVIRPIRSYPEILVRALESPGSELIIENMFTRADDHFMRFSLWLEGDYWRDVVYAMMMANLGTPLAYVGKDGDVEIHPPADEKVFAQSIIMLVRTEAVPTDRDVGEALRSFLEAQHQASA